MDLVAGAALVVCWSSGFIGATLGTRAAPVDTVLAWRTIGTATVLGCWALVRAERVRPGDLARQAVLGLLVQVLYLGGVFAAAGAGVPAGTSALITALQPLLVAALAGRVLGERTARRQQLGLVIGAVGVAVVVSGDLHTGTAAAAAYLLPVFALAALAGGTLLEQRWMPPQSLVTGLALQSGVAAVVFTATAAADGHLAPPAAGSFWLAIGWLAVLAGIGGYGSYLFVVRRSGATRASTLLYLTPPTTAIWAWLLFGQTPQVLAIPGALVCALGLVLVLTRASRSALLLRRADQHFVDGDPPRSGSRCRRRRRRCPRPPARSIVAKRCIAASRTSSRRWSRSSLSTAPGSTSRHADVALRHLLPQRLAERADAELREVVDAGAGAGDAAGDAADRHEVGHLPRRSRRGLEQVRERRVRGQSRPLTLRATIRSHSSHGASSIGPSSMTPALLTTVSSRPRPSTAAATAARASAPHRSRRPRSRAPAPGAAMRAARSFEPVAPSRDERDLAPCRASASGGRLADAAARASDQCDGSVQRVCHVTILPRGAGGPPGRSEVAHPAGRRRISRCGARLASATHR